jgi:hypothetical protein
MQWWAWVLIWVGLVLLLLAMLAACGWMLFGKVKLAFAALSELMAKTEALAAASEAIAPEPFTPSVVRPFAEVSEEHRVHSERSSARRESRREARLARGKMLTSAEATRRVANNAL